MSGLRGKTALVTHACGTAGAAAALSLASAGARVLVHDDHSSTKAKACARRFQSKGWAARAITMDVSTPDGPRRLAQATREVVGERLDILVFNATAQSFKTDTEAALVEAFDAQLIAHARAPYFLVRHLLPILHRGSSLILTSMPPAHEAWGDVSPYPSPARAMAGLAGHLAKGLAQRGIRVNAITLYEAPSHKPPEATPRSIAEAMEFLASDDAQGVTGQTLMVRVAPARRLLSNVHVSHRS